MKKTYKVLSILMIVLMIVFTCTNVFAAEAGTSIDTSFLEGIKANEDLGDADDKMQSIGSTILTIVTNAAMILAVVIVAVLGVKYMMGSTEEKAEYKKTMIPYLVGAVLVFGAGAIGKMVVQMGASLL